jgi:uncharacterized protein YndB with AHSA1/START domain
MTPIDTLTARVSVRIDAPSASVWDALMDPEKIQQYMPVASVAASWRVGSPIVWTSEFQGKPFEVHGTVLRVEPQRVLEYSHSLPVFRSSDAARPREGYRVTIELTDDGARTQVSVTEHGNTTERELAHSEGGWRLALGNMKALLEGTSITPMR